MASQRVLEGCFGAVVLALLTGCAYLQASTVTRLLGSALAVPPALPRPPPRASPSRPRATAAALLERNPFDSTTGPLVPRSTPLITDASADPLAAPACEGQQVFIVSESADKHWSMAVLRGPGELRPHTRRVGDEVVGRRVEYIGFNPRQSTPAVWLSNGSKLCQSVLFGAKLAAPNASPSAALAHAPTEAHPERLRIVPEFERGKLLGVRLLGIRAGGAFAAIGLQNGDRLEAINGLPMDSAGAALQIAAQLRTKTDFDVRFARRGQTRQVTLHLK